MGLRILTEAREGGRLPEQMFFAADSAAQRASITVTSEARAIRWLTPGMAVTMDYNPTRLNIEIDKTGEIFRINCG